MSNLLDEVAKDDIVLPTEDKLSRLTHLARTQLAIQDEIEELQLRLRQREEARDAISEREIPEIMHEIGVRDITLLDGHKLKIQPFYTGKITGPDCYTWLENEGHGDIVKTDIIVSFRMSDEEKPAKVRQLLHEHGIEWNEISGVHHSTLKAFIKDRIQTGQPIDRELFQVYTGFKTVIK